MESAFQYTNPALVKLDFRINQGFSGVGNKHVRIPLKISVNVDKDQAKNEALVSLSCGIGEENETLPFLVLAEEQARFRWETELSNDTVNILLNQNAPSLLLSFLRPIIAQVTLASPYGAYYIPFINFTKQNKNME